MRFKALTVMTLKITVFWDVTPSILADIYHHSEEPAASIFRIKE
jgi:hypothetical protein